MYLVGLYYKNTFQYWSTLSQRKETTGL